MNSLIITAHPSTISITKKIAEVYFAIKLENGTSVELIDLYRSDNFQSFLHFENKNELTQETREQQYYQNKIIEADELVFIFPLWWGGMPAIMKNWIDWNFSECFILNCSNNKNHKLLKNKKVKIFATSSASNLLYFFTGLSLAIKHIFQKNFIEYCGMTLEEFHIFGNISNVNIYKLTKRIEKSAKRHNKSLERNI